MIEFFLNGKPMILEVAPQETVLELVRRLNLAGTKEGCGEGDCGACTVVVGEKDGDRVHYRAVTSCLMLAPQLDGKHLITIEGLAQGDELHPIQEAVLEGHATQCGFCTPGVIMSLFGLFLETTPTEEDIQAALEGNLCRCTGYVAIKHAGETLRDAQLSGIKGPIRPAYLDEVEPKLSVRAIAVEKGEQTFHAPRTGDELRGLLRKYPDARLMNGGTDLVVAIKKHGASIPHLIDLSRLEGMKEIQVTPQEIRIGGGVSLARIREATQKSLPELSAAIGNMASHQVRTLATLAGNLGNASPIADTAPLLLVAGARMVIEGEKSREIPLEAFYQGYKQTALAPGEWIREIRIPRRGNFLHFEKVSKRKALDISTVNGAIALSLDGRTVKEARLAFGGVAPTPVLAKRAAEALLGELSVEAAREAARIALSEFEPISDVRGSKEYRKQLVEGILTKHVLAAMNLGGNQ